MILSLTAEQKVMLRFLVTMGILSALYFLWFAPRAWTLPIIGPNYSRFIHYSMLSLTEGTVFLLGLMGHQAETFDLRNIDLYDSVINIHVRNYCLGVDMTAMFIALVVSFPGKWKHRAWFIPVGVVGIIGINVLRVAMLCLTTIHNGHHQFIDHHNIFNTITTAFIFLMFVAWVRMHGPRLVR
ncbi:MAG: exosortase/archaeosortase family protein [Flavobacteriales bacterium]|nr:exosortase/archaeosortase family protein [Flavobacteriales bacterium]